MKEGREKRRVLLDDSTPVSLSMAGIGANSVACEGKRETCRGRETVKNGGPVRICARCGKRARMFTCMPDHLSILLVTHIALHTSAQAVLVEMAQRGSRAILFIDDIHNLVPAPGQGVSACLLTHLAASRGECAPAYAPPRSINVLAVRMGALTA
eukprot:83312-Chlamydomonas_euryale.AAC.14